jgi:2-oxoglutarate ferredoxin oxidoreductase subunit alpha
MASQDNMMQARWGSHGCYGIIALSPSSPQEMYELTIRAFNLSEKYRTPVLVMADAVVGHMSEKVVIPPPEEIEQFPRRKPSVRPEEYLPFLADSDLVPPMASAGDGYRFHISGLTHDERGYPAINIAAQDRLVKRLLGKIEQNKSDIIEIEEDGVADAEVVVCSYGISARISRFAVERAREEGIRVGMMKLVTVWPFPEERIREIAGKIKAFVVPEINCGQIALEVERCTSGMAKTVLVPHSGGGVHRPEVIISAIEEAAR